MSGGWPTGAVPTDEKELAATMFVLGALSNGGAQARTLDNGTIEFSFRNSARGADARIVATCKIELQPVKRA